MWCWYKVVPLVIGALLWSAPAHAAFWQATIKLGDWQAHAETNRLIELDAIRDLLARFEEKEGNTVTIRYPGGDAGSAWAVQFRNRLVAYGIPSSYIAMMPGSGGLDILHVSLTSPD